MTQYKSYAKEGSFSEFQLRVPDQTDKIRARKTRQIQGMKAAEDFRRENQQVYLETQKYVQGLEELNRETNFQLENKERESYRKFLERDYKTRMDNLQSQNAARQNELKAVTAFSQTAVQLVGNILEEREDQKRLAAMDVLARTGATYNDILAFQKINANLTREEFAAHDILQKIIGPDGDPDLIDGFYKIYQNRNTKRWVEHKQLLQNTVNNFPGFIEAKIAALEGAPIDDVDKFLTDARRDFMNVEFNPNKVRPEVLQGAGVYKGLQNVINEYKGQLIQISRTRQAEALKDDRLRAFAVTYAESGWQGIIDAKSTNPSKQKNMHIVEWFVESMKNPGGAYGLDVEDIEQYITLPGSGTNGQTFEESFFGKPELAATYRAIQQGKQARLGLVELERNEEQRQIDSRAVELINQAGGDDDGLTQDEYNNVTLQLKDEFGRFVSSQVLEDASQLTNIARYARATKQYNDFLFRQNALTVERARNGVYLNQQDQINAIELARRSQALMDDPEVTNHVAEIRSRVINDPRGKTALVLEQLKATKANTYNIGAVQDKYEQRYRRLVTDLTAADPDADAVKVRNDARRITLQELEEEQVSGIDDNGFYTSKLQQDNYDDLDEIKQKVDRELVSVNRVLVKQVPMAQKFKELAPMLDADLIANSLGNALNPNYETPGIIRYISDKTGITPFKVFQGIAPHIGDGSLKVQTDMLSAAQIKNLEPATFQRIRNKHRTYERVGRANVELMRSGDRAPIRLPIVQYVSGDPAIAGKKTGRILYDPSDGPRGHGGKNYHNHYEFETRADAMKAKQIFDNDARCNVTSYLRPHDKGSAHAYGLALDVAPDPSLPKDKEAEWSAYCNSLIGFDPNE